jgi:uncharacterized surface protein with fasciclin (FAS1) repeats
MVSYGPDVQSYNFTHMYTFVDLRSKDEKTCIVKGSIFDYLNKKEYSKMRSIIEKAQMIDRMNEPQANYTLFVAEDKNIPHDLDTLDDGMARQILNASIIQTKVDKDLLTASPVCYFNTRNPMMRMYVTNISNRTILNDAVKVIKYDIKLNNGIIHVVDGLIIPNENTFMN